MQRLRRRVWTSVGLVVLYMAAIVASQSESSTEEPDMQPTLEEDLEEIETDTLLSPTGRRGTFPLAPNRAVLHSIAAPEVDGKYPDVVISLTVFLPSSNVDIYCEPGSEDTVRILGPPTPLDYTWKSDHRHGEDYVFISKYHPDYETYIAQTDDGRNVALFVCSILEKGDQSAVVTLGLDYDYTPRDIVDSELAIMEDIFDACCQGEGRCERWKTHMQQSNARAADLCHFHGMVCSDRGNLLRLNFNAMNMNCSFPGNKFAKLEYLEKLHLKGNPMTGRTPDVMKQLLKMERLEIFEISDAHFEGELAEDVSDPEADICQIARAGTMAHLDLENCNITGKLPVCLFDGKSKLNEIDLNRNRLTGELPVTTIFASSLLNIFLESNQLTGEIPVEWTTFGNLQMLDLSFNAFIGEIPYGFGRMESLKLLKLDSNRLTGGFPNDITLSKSLLSMNISTNQLSGQLPATFSESSSLAELYLHQNNFSGSIPVGFGDLRSLVALDLGNNQFSGRIPDELGNLRNLITLFLDHNRFTGTLPVSFGALTELAVLFANANELSGEVPEEWATMQSLRLLYLDDNELEGDVPSWLQSPFLFEAVPLTVILDDNALSGFKPDWYSSEVASGRLAVFRAARNRIKGEFPRRLAEQRNLLLLDLSNNEMEGSLPGERRDLTRVLLLNLSRNAFSGEIPATLGDTALFSTTATTLLDLSYNNLTGEIPSFLYLEPNSDAERRIYLQGNELTYECPLEAPLEYINGLECEDVEESEIAIAQQTAPEVDSSLSVTPLGGTTAPESNSDQRTVSVESDSSPGVLVIILATAAALAFAVVVLLFAFFIKSRRGARTDHEPGILMTPVGAHPPVQGDTERMLTGVDSSDRV